MQLPDASVQVIGRTDFALDCLIGAQKLMEVILTAPDTSKSE